jgi:hypothetical protein
VILHLRKDDPYYRSVAEDGLNGRMEFNCVITVWPDGTLTDASRDVRRTAPESADGDADALTDGSAEQGWSLLDGFSSQYNYCGPVMHASEYIGGSMARHILSTPGHYVAILAYYSCSEDSCGGTLDDPCPEGQHSEGWCVAFRELKPEDYPGESGYLDCPCCGETYVGGACTLCSDWCPTSKVRTTRTPRCP